MGWGRVTKLLVAVLAGVPLTLLFYLFLFLVQIQNADPACESYPQTVPGADYEDVRGFGFENGYLNLGGKCTYYMDDGTVVHAREPGWWFSGTIAGFVAVFAGAVVLFVRRRGHTGIVFGVTTLFAPPLGFALAVAASRRSPSQGPVAL